MEEEVSSLRGHQELVLEKDMDTYRQKVQGEQRNCSFRQVTLEVSPHSLDQCSKASLGVSRESDWLPHMVPPTDGMLFSLKPQKPLFICSALPAAGIQATVHLAPCVPACGTMTESWSQRLFCPPQGRSERQLCPPPSALRPPCAPVSRLWTSADEQLFSSVCGSQ